MSTDVQLIKKAARVSIEHRVAPWPATSMFDLRCSCGWVEDTVPSRHAEHFAAAVIEAVRADIAAEALREAAKDTLEHNAWSSLGLLQKFVVAASHGDAQRFSPEQIAHWLRDRADALSTPSEPADDPRPEAWDEGRRAALDQVGWATTFRSIPNPYRTPSPSPSTPTPASGQAEEEA